MLSIFTGKKLGRSPCPVACRIFCCGHGAYGGSKADRRRAGKDFCRAGARPSSGAATPNAQGALIFRTLRRKMFFSFCEPCTFPTPVFPTALLRPGTSALRIARTTSCPNSQRSAKPCRTEIINRLCRSTRCGLRQTALQKIVKHPAACSAERRRHRRVVELFVGADLPVAKFPEENPARARGLAGVRNPAGEFADGHHLFPLGNKILRREVQNFHGMKNRVEELRHAVLAGEIAVPGNHRFQMAHPPRSEEHTSE